MEPHGSGGPTIAFVSGYRTSGMYWIDDLIQPEAPRAMVMAGMSDFTQPVTHDRLGT